MRLRQPRPPGPDPRVSGPAWSVAMHLIGAHADGMAVARSWRENVGAHTHEHDGPGTIRDHDRFDFSFGDAAVEAVLEEPEREESGG